jgi:hypothetical protein
MPTSNHFVICELPLNCNIEALTVIRAFILGKGQTQYMSTGC